MKQHNLFYDICYKSVTLYAYHLGFMESPKQLIHLYNLDTSYNDGKVHTLSHHSIEKIISGDKELVERYLE